MGKHTEGPWAIAQNSGGPLYVIAQPHWPRICTIRDIDDKHEETNANARLIAAAPELLQACKAMLESDGEFGLKLEQNGNAFLTKDEAIYLAARHAAQDAIAKAENCS